MNLAVPCSEAGLDIGSDAAVQHDHARRAIAPVTMTVSVVIPAKNEAANLPWVFRRMPAWVHEVIVVDGLSTDGTIDVARECWPDVVILHERRPGKGAAVRAGFEAATGDIVAMLDADGSMDPLEIAQFVRQCIHVVTRNGVRNLIGFLDRVGRDRGERLLAIPLAAGLRIAQPPHDGDEALKRHERAPPLANLKV